MENEVLTAAAAAAAASLHSCLTLCDPIDGSPPGSAVPGIPQARTLECVAISFSNAWKWKVKVKSFSFVQLLATPWTTAHQAPLSMGFSRQEYWSGVPLPSPEVLIKRRHIHFSLMGLCIFLNLYTIFLMEIIMYELLHLTNNTEKYSHIMLFLKGTWVHARTHTHTETHTQNFSIMSGLILHVKLLSVLFHSTPKISSY